MRAVYPLEVVSGHLIAVMGETRAFLDTGAPISIGRGRLSVLGQDVNLRPALANVTPEYLSEKIGTRVDALLGTDVLARYYFDVDIDRATCTFTRSPSRVRGRRIPVTQFLKTPIVQATIAGRPVRLIVDTGAQLGYLTEALVQGCERLEPRRDFHPLLGEFTVDVYRVPMEVGGFGASLPFGVATPAIRQMLEVSGTDGIIGTDLLKLFWTRFALPDGELGLDEFIA